VSITDKEYTDAFNERLDMLNDIISERNKSGVQYRVKELTPDGRLIFETPKQNIPKKLSKKEKENLEWYDRDPEDFAVNKVNLKQQPDGTWSFEDTDDKVFETKQDALNYLKEIVDNNLRGHQTLEGTSQWGVRINPGQWRGEVLDIPNTEYYRAIPGLEMSNTTASVFSDRNPRRGTGAYEAINEYLKKLDLGRVKPGFNSQTEFSKSAWENFIKSGRGVGFYQDPRVVYGTLKSMLPYVGVGSLTAGALQEDKRRGGSIFDRPTKLPKRTTKNVVTGINKLSMIGPLFQKRRLPFDPNSKYETGGEWLNKYDNQDVTADWLSKYQ